MSRSDRHWEAGDYAKVVDSSHAESESFVVGDVACRVAPPFLVVEVRLVGKSKLGWGLDGGWGW